MKELHFDDQIKLSQTNPQLIEYRKNDELFIKFWQFCKKITAKNSKDKKEWDSILDELSSKTGAIHKELNTFYLFLKETPLAAGIGHWIKEISADKLWREKCVKGMTRLIEKNLVPLTNGQGKDMTLDEFKIIGHEKIIENIRCVKEWTPLEKEELIQCYVQFSHHLAQYTMNFISPSFDPDRHRTSNRVIKYEIFLDFVQQLSSRDALMAQLLYFGAPTIEDVIFLKANSIYPDRSTIRFKGKEITFPKHLIQDLTIYLNGKIESKSLVFKNVRGKEVDRTHLSQAFTRACKRMRTGIKITPGILLKFEDKAR